MKKGEIYTGMIERIEFPNKGIFYAEGEKVVVKHTLPGQRVEAVIAKKTKRKMRRTAPFPFGEGGI